MTLDGSAAKLSADSTDLNDCSDNMNTSELLERPDHSAATDKHPENIVLKPLTVHTWKTWQLPEMKPNRVGVLRGWLAAV